MRVGWAWGGGRVGWALRFLKAKPGLCLSTLVLPPSFSLKILTSAFCYSYSKLRCRPERLSQITLECMKVASGTWKLDLDCKLHCEPGKQWLSWSEFKAAT